MKTIFTIIFLSIFSTFSHAQYQSLFGEESTSWNMSEWAFGIFEEFPHLQIFYARADTIINGKTYKKISPYAAPYDDIDASYLREDTIEGKAWCLRRETGGEEFLIMDLSLEVGDTFAISDGHHYPGGYFYPVVDSVYYYEGRKYVRLDFLSDEKLQMIEGVGTNIGTFYQPFDFAPISYYTLCQTKDGDTLSYVNNSSIYLGRCDVSAVGLNERKKPKYQLNIFPNPTSGKTIIDLQNEFIVDKNKGITMRVMDITGREVMRQKISFFPYDLDVAPMPSGVYTVVVGDIAVGKFLKN